MYLHTVESPPANKYIRRYIPVVRVHVPTHSRESSTNKYIRRYIPVVRVHVPTHSRESSC